MSAADQTSRYDRQDRLLDKLEIREVLVTWNRALDRGDVELLASTYTEDAFDNHGPYQYRSAREAAQDYVDRHLRYAKRHLHTTVQEHIELDRDVAYSESYSVAYLVAEQTLNLGAPYPNVTEVLVTVGLRYFDRFERIDGAWKIAARDMIIEWRSYADSVPIETDIPIKNLGFYKHEYRGSRSVDDPAYDMPGLLAVSRNRGR